MDAETCLKKLQYVGVLAFATVDAQGNPQVRNISAIHYEPEALYFFTARGKDFCRELLKRLKKEGVHTAVDTCGCVDRRAIDAVMPYTDQFLYDVKAIDEAVHICCTGVSNRRILENLAYIDACGKAIEIRIPYVPGMNDGEIARIGAFLKNFKSVGCVKVLPYHSFAGSKYEALGLENTMPRTEPPDDEELSRAVARLKAFGLYAVSGRE